MKKAIGILGGMGPGASAYMYKLLIDMAISKFGAKNNDDFPEIILYSLPVPDFISDQKKKKIALKMLYEKLVHLNKMDLSNIAIACNTAHILLGSLQRKSKNKFKSMIVEVCLELNKARFKKIGLMGTPILLRSKIYQDELDKLQIKTITPLDNEVYELDEVIRNVLAGKLTKVDQITVLKIADSLSRRGAEAIILGCTELPLIFPKKYKAPVFNSVKILALSLLRDYYK